MIEGISTRRVESTPANDPTLGVASRQQQEQRGERQAGAGASSFGDMLSLSPEAQQQLGKLQQRDREVRSHEQAHISAGGQHVSSGATYSYTKGPDGRQYVVGGSVSIDTSPIPGNAEATEEKARMVRAAALAPGSPSAQDQSVAAQAASMEMQAQTEKRTQEGEGVSAGAGFAVDGDSKDGRNSPGGQRGRNGLSAVGGLGDLGGTGDIDESPGVVRQTPNASNTQGTQGAPGTPGPMAATGEASTPLAPPLSAEKAEAGRNTGTLFGAMEMQVRGDRVAALYQAQQDKFIPPTALAPNGTGIGITV